MLDAAGVAASLGIAEGTNPWHWLKELEAIGQDELEPLELDRRQAARWLDLLRVPAEDAAVVLATLPSRDREPAWWWCLERDVHRLLSNMGEPDAPRGRWPAFEGNQYDDAQRCHFIRVALAVAPATLSYLSGLGIPEEIAFASMADLARHMAIHRRVHRSTGVEAAWWITLCLRGELVELGRLQYNRFTLGGAGSPLWYPENEAIERGAGFRPGDSCLGIHIPEGSPLSPAAVQSSLEMASDFFCRFFTVAQRRVATCMSWLLDEQLAEYLPAKSNIVAFQRRFETVPGSEEGDAQVLKFVFRAGPDADLSRLPQRSLLEQAAVAHLRAGRHWQVRTGWLDLPPAGTPPLPGEA